jgi:hypothetical protein
MLDDDRQLAMLDTFCHHSRLCFDAIAQEHTRPTVLLRPALMRDGNQWCFLYGDNIQDGIAGFGDTPYAASYAFDKAWHFEKAVADTKPAERAENNEGAGI